MRTNQGGAMNVGVKKKESYRKVSQEKVIQKEEKGKNRKYNNEDYLDFYRVLARFNKATIIPFVHYLMYFCFKAQTGIYHNMPKRETHILIRDRKNAESILVGQETKERGIMYLAKDYLNDMLRMVTMWLLSVECETLEEQDEVERAVYEEFKGGRGYMSAKEGSSGRCNQFVSAILYNGYKMSYEEIGYYIGKSKDQVYNYVKSWDNKVYPIITEMYAKIKEKVTRNSHQVKMEQGELLYVRRSKTASSLIVIDAKEQNNSPTKYFIVAEKDFDIYEKNIKKLAYHKVMMGKDEKLKKEIQKKRNILVAELKNNSSEYMKSEENKIIYERIKRKRERERKNKRNKRERRKRATSKISRRNNRSK